MRFLCLHGMGTSSEIFGIQTAALRYELGEEHTYDFVEGAVPYPMAPGIDSIVPSDTETFTYFSKDSVDQAVETLSELRTYIIDNGPFGGVLAFSEGAALAAMLLLQPSSPSSSSSPFPSVASANPNPLFQVAIFLCGGIPVCPRALTSEHKRRFLSGDEDGEVISIPTAHIWAANETLWPGFGPVLAGLCKKEERWEFVHNGGHQVPMKGLELKRAARVARKAIERACERQ